MTTEITIVKDKTFETIRTTVNKMVDMIRPTLGPASNKVIISKIPYAMVVDDGVQIARDFELPDPVENSIVKIVREVAVKTNDRVGDGTTGSLIILQAIFNEISRRTKIDGRKIELELKKGLEEVKTQLTKSAKQIKTKEDLKKAALVAFDNEPIAEMIADLYFKLGKDNVITIDRSPGMTTQTEMTDGIKLDVGYISPYMINNPARMETVFEKPYILITDYRLTEGNDLMPLMDKMMKEGARNLVLIAENVEQGALATLVINLPQVMNPQTRQPGVFPSVAINLPHAEDRKVLLEDLAILTGAKMFTASKGDKLQDAEIADLGRADRFICKREESIIVGPKGNKQSIKKAVTSLWSVYENEPVENRKKSIMQRIGLFTGKLAVIKVGAPTENEQKALKYKVEDAVNSVKSAFKSGVVCGAGLALSRLKTSSPILNEALKYPARQLRENMGIDEEQELGVDEALNVVTGKKGKFMEVGVMDPVEVLLAATESAVSIATLLITTSGMIVESQKTPKE